MAYPINGGDNFEVRNITANSTTDTPIDFSQKVNKVIIKCRTAVDLYLRQTVSNSNYFTITSGTVFTFDCGVGNTIPFYIRSASTTPVVEAIGIY